MPLFVVHFAHFHLDFRLAELEALATLENVRLSYDPRDYLASSPFLKIELDSVDDARKLIQRSILIKDIVELWGAAESLDQLIELVKADPDRWGNYMDVSFKFNVETFGVTLPMKVQVERINRFAFLDFRGPIDLKTPDVTFAYYEDYGDNSLHGIPSPEAPLMTYFGVLVSSGNRSLVSKYDLKKREYLGITSMDAELSLVMANQAQVKPGSFVLDPFVGTGSFLFTCAHFGAFTMGADIDGRQIRGKDDKSISSNVRQYNLEGRVLDNIVTDMAHHPWRQAEFWDAIVCDPPYGVRAGAKKIGHNSKVKPTADAIKANGEPRYPQTVPYEMHHVLEDLVEFSAKFLRPGGRLVYWLPTVTSEYKPEDVPQHPQFRLIANSEQNFGKWARRLITMEKIGSTENAGEGSADGDATAQLPAHAGFRGKYFAPKDSRQ
ncbi:S-adenosyl-L-methionine-dependent methyltransferase [Polychytrium aggregatum]|uniref:S-adenosyl-L-methionine-dependent methyltransferase n=1 Tax=Polychytrium aggregatum TaxID=110093 RepID=UPI0022FDE7BF|nr:S-adenosyl-L-methionine-dependent methyltransferase [Polychytrium aggregatum]KAI9197520.1 S-adenosyl-L-methionine-dependent methyltransferase [Polychytrium aggregatum]